MVWQIKLFDFPILKLAVFEYKMYISLFGESCQPLRLLCPLFLTFWSIHYPIHYRICFIKAIFFNSHAERVLDIFLMKKWEWKMKFYSVYLNFIVVITITNYKCINTKNLGYSYMFGQIFEWNLFLLVHIMNNSRFLYEFLWNKL